MPSQKTDLQKYLCIHGHFYQPPRENPWLDTIEYQETAFPYHDWNERITRECYGPNARGRLHGKGGRILKLLNNYEYMSFNFGPTLLTWLEESHPWIYEQILTADRSSRARYGGHSNALAQVYNHIIMPLASTRDKLTQIRWGLADFRHRFGRDAEGMWLAETAVDNESLKLMANEGIRFTILSPTQAKAIRPLSFKKDSFGGQVGSDKDHDSVSWRDVSGGRIDPTRPYRVLLDSEGGLSIDVFFYDGPLSRAIAYEKILASGEDLLKRVNKIFDSHTDGPVLVSIATDGESYGHHFKFGEMALTWLFDHIEQNQGTKLTNFGLFLELFPPENEVKLFENSAWSCPHGIERWRADCGCSVSRNPLWNQAWRTPLREGLDWLAMELSSIFESRTSRLLKDPWEARNDYIRVLLNQSEEEINLFLKAHSISPLNDDEKVEILQLMESQRMALYMFTSCGWFFDDISGIEAVQVLMYASKAIDLVWTWSEENLESGLMEFLIQAESNDPRYGHGDNVYQTLVKQARIDPTILTAHYGLISLVKEAEIGSWLSESVTVLWKQNIISKGIMANIGEVNVVEKITSREFTRTYLALWIDGKVFTCLVGGRSTLDPDQLTGEIRSVLSLSPDEGQVDIFYRYVPDTKRFGLKDLISDTRRWIINGLSVDLYRRIKDSMGIHYGSLQSFIKLLKETGEQAPSLLNNLFRLWFADELLTLLNLDKGKEPIDFNDLVTQASLIGPVPRNHSNEKRTVEFFADVLKDPTLKQETHAFLKRQIDSFARSNDTVFLENILGLLNLMRDMNIDLDLWESQNLFYELKQDDRFINSLTPDMYGLFKELGQKLGFIMGD